MARRGQRPEDSLPTFDAYQAPPASHPEAPMSYGAEAGYEEDGFGVPEFTYPQQVSTPEALQRLQQIKLREAAATDAYRLRMGERALGLHAPQAAPRIAGRPPVGSQQQIASRSAQEIEARYRLAQSGQAGRRQLPPGSGRPNPNQLTDAPRQPQKADNKVRAPRSLGGEPEATKMSLRETLFSTTRRKAISVASIGALVVVGYVGSQNGPESASELAATAVVKKEASEYKNDTFSPGTTLAQVKFTTGQGTEVHVPVELKTPGQEAYVNIPIKQFSLSGMAIKASGATVATGGGRATWAKQDKNGIYQIDRGALNLAVDPWTSVLGKTEAEALASITNLLLPPVSGLPLFVDGQAVSDPKKYPLSDKGINQLSAVIDTSNPKQTKFSAAAIKTIAAELELATIVNLEDPNQCSSVHDALDQANVADLVAQKNVAAGRIAISAKSKYGNASSAFTSIPEIKSAFKGGPAVAVAAKEADAGKKAEALNKAWAAADLPLAGFTISCTAEAVLPKVTQPAATSSPTPSATPTTKK